jgi:hypothetical protein
VRVAPAHGPEVDICDGKVAKAAKVANFFGIPPGPIRCEGVWRRAEMLYNYVYYHGRSGRASHAFAFW